LGHVSARGNAVHLSVDRSCRLRHAVGLVGPSTRLRLAAASSGKTPRPVRLGTRTVYLDVAYEAEMVAVELDGSAYHGDRDRDSRRDIALAALGWLTLRFSHRRLHNETEPVRRELRITLEIRRRQLDGRRTA